MYVVYTSVGPVAADDGIEGSSLSAQLLNHLQLPLCATTHTHTHTHTHRDK